ncbi:carboxylesterase/lipase family protein [Bradyrhizobium prioriisuperbiae]|uniref:carboxylesterase/lipase family protein n=1 Tax=Bradyrhizobium prioriisuperbiae TaxID=2854389 RepID=UPI0028F0C279|nr:carboxylesterase family protein [Bradyrhizobium prioritasuperba]
MTTAFSGSDPQLTKPVATTGGKVVGVAETDLNVFRGIPFAAPPVRNLRWRDPQPAVPWSGTRIADRFSPMCLQSLRPKNSVFYLGEEASSEDCLYLNIWAPRAGEPKKPVMVFIYGGGWTIGSASLPLYSGDGLARKGVVVVSFNYRVGTLGFLSHPELAKESPDGTSGNYGLKDMVAALQWVKANVARFGGDPQNVTLYGQSAGAAAISLLMASPKAKGLFQKAIGESGAFGTGERMLDRAAAETAGVALAEKLKAPSITDMRNLGGDVIVTTGNTSRPIIDGVFLPRQPSEIFKSGAQMAIPILVGANANEATVYPVVRRAEDFRNDAVKTYGERAGELLALYPATDDTEAATSSYQLFRDRVFAGPVRAWAKAQSGAAPVFMYHFARPQPFVKGIGFQQQADAVSFGAYHGAEMAYAFGNLDVLNALGKTRDWSDDDRKLSRQLSLYWVNFAATGNPNANGLPVWPRYRAADEKVLFVGDALSVRDIPNKPQLDFLER